MVGEWQYLRVAQAPQISETVVDGVRTLWCALDGPLTAMLIFRVGRADETLATSGVSHLLEHLTLFPLGRDSHPGHFNGEVGPVTTSFYAHGDPAEIALFLRRVCEGLRELPLDRLEVEREILLSEAAQRSTNTASDSLLIWRYGSASYGLSAYAELGLRRLEGGDLTDWSATGFTAANAVLALTGPPPADLSLPLPRGEHKPTPRPTSALESTPAWYSNEGSSTCGLLTTVPRSSPAHALRHVLEKTVTAKLRYELGASYSPTVAYEPRDGETAHLWLLAEPVAGRHDDVRDLVLSLLAEPDQLIVDEGTLAEWRRLRADAVHQPGFAQGWLFANAWDAALGADLLTYAQLLETSQATGVEQVRETATHAGEQALYLLPDDAPPLVEMTRAPSSSRTVLAGREFTLRTPSGSSDSTVLIVGRDGLTKVADERHWVTVRFDTATAALAWPWGQRVLYGADGFVAVINPTVWVDGWEASALFDEYASAELVIPMPDPPDAPSRDSQPGSDDARSRTPNFQGLLKGCRDTAGAAPRNFSLMDRLSYLNPRTPMWCTPSDPLTKYVKDRGMLLKEGTIVWGALVQANTLMFQPGTHDHAGEVLFSVEPERVVDPLQLSRVAHRVFGLKGVQQSEPALARIAEHLGEEYARAFGLEVPKSLSPEIPSAISTVLLHRKHLPSGYLKRSIFPILVLVPDPWLAMVLPSRYWPTELTKWWDAGE